MSQTSSHLIQKDDLGNWGVKGLPWENLYVGEVITDKVHEKLYGCLWKLMEYEDTGLSPEQVEDLTDQSKFNKQISMSDYRQSAEASVELQMQYPIDPLPCPFCGEELKEFPMIMIVEPVRSEEYLMAELSHGHFLGTDNWFHVHCIRCGATGARGLTREHALMYWNERGNSSLRKTLGYEKIN